jgi:hypothetical protein
MIEDWFTHVGPDTGKLRIYHKCDPPVKNCFKGFPKLTGCGLLIQCTDGQMRCLECGKFPPEEILDVVLLCNVFVGKQLYD